MEKVIVECACYGWLLLGAAALAFVVDARKWQHNGTNKRKPPAH